MTATSSDKLDRIESVLLTLSDEIAHLASEVRELGTEVKLLSSEVRTGFSELKAITQKQAETAEHQERSIDRLVGIVEVLIQRQGDR